MTVEPSKKASINNLLKETIKGGGVFLATVFIFIY
jgi:hypothetical protein